MLCVGRKQGRAADGNAFNLFMGKADPIRGSGSVDASPRQLYQQFGDVGFVDVELHPRATGGETLPAMGPVIGRVGLPVVLHDRPAAATDAFGQ